MFSITPYTGKLISSAAIPEFIQRDDLMDQLRTWVTIEAVNNGARNFGLPMRVEEHFLDDNDNKVGSGTVD